MHARLARPGVRRAAPQADRSHSPVSPARGGAGRPLDRTRQIRRPRHNEDPTADPPWSPLAWCWLLSLSGVASRVLPPGVVLIGVRALILEL